MAGRLQRRGPEGSARSIQAITYRWSEFEGEMPAFVVLYPGPEEFFVGVDTAYQMRCFLQKSNVGYFVFNDRKRSWRILMGSVSYFDSRSGGRRQPTRCSSAALGPGRETDDKEQGSK